MVGSARLGKVAWPSRIVPSRSGVEAPGKSPRALGIKRFRT